MLDAIIGGIATGLIGSLFGGSSEPNTGTTIIPKPKEYTDTVKKYLGVLRDYPLDEVYRAQISQAMNYMNPPLVNLGGITLPAFGVQRRAISSLRDLPSLELWLAKEAYYPLGYDTWASPSTGQLLGGMLMGVGSGLLGNLLG